MAKTKPATKKTAKPVLPTGPAPTHTAPNKAAAKKLSEELGMPINLDPSGSFYLVTTKAGRRLPNPCYNERQVRHLARRKV